MIQSERLLQHFLTLTGFDSPTGHERLAADYCISALRRLGFYVEEDDAGIRLNGDTGNLYAKLDGIGEPLLFSCHLDTVTPCCSKTVLVDLDGRIHSDETTILGADDAAGIAEIIEGIQSVLEDGSAHRPVEVIFSVSEEKQLLGAKQFDFQKIQSKEGYILDVDGPIGTAAIAAPRSYRFHATVHGRSAHAALSPELGVNAAVIASTAIAALPWGRLDEDTTSNIGVMHVDGAANIVPASCYLESEVRSLSPAKADARIALMKKTFEDACQRFGGTLDLNIFRSYEAYQVAPSHAVIRRFQRACQSAGIQPTLTRSCGGSDNSVYTPQGLTGIVIAPGMHEIHGIHEHTSIQEMTSMATVVSYLITDMQE